MMKKDAAVWCAWMLRGGVILLGGILLVGALCWVLVNGGHNPNHDIDMEQARKAANRVHPPPKPGDVMGPEKGG